MAGRLAPLAPDAFEALADDERSGRALCGVLYLSLAHGEVLRVPDSAEGFGELFDAVTHPSHHAPACSAADFYSFKFVSFV